MFGQRAKGWKRSHLSIWNSLRHLSDPGHTCARCALPLKEERQSGCPFRGQLDPEMAVGSCGRSPLSLGILLQDGVQGKCGDLLRSRLTAFRPSADLAAISLRFV